MISKDEARRVFRDASQGYGRAGTADMPDGPYMAMSDAADVYASLVKPDNPIRNRIQAGWLAREAGRVVSDHEYSPGSLSAQEWLEGWHARNNGHPFESIVGEYPCGHQRTPENTKFNNNRPSGRCRTCQQVHERRSQAKRRASTTPPASPTT